MTANIYPVLETERLFLRSTTEEDADLILELLNTPKWKAYIGNRDVHTIEESANYIKTKMLPQLEKRGFGNFTLIRKSDKEKIGTCGLYDREGLEGLDLGYALLPDFEGNGFALEAAREVVRFGFEELREPSIQAITSKTNIQSQKLLERLGMSCKGVTILPGEKEELRVYNLVMGQ
jgi:RimJ/RimL family protein N-acetyltransferase